MTPGAAGSPRSAAAFADTMVAWTRGEKERGDDQKPSAPGLGGAWSERGLRRAVHLVTVQPLPLGAHYTHWLLGLAIGILLGLYFYVRRDRYSEPGPDADETRFPR
jgi:hypothetical protein